MNCRDLPLVEKLADGECTPAERSRAEAHLEHCRACRAHVDFLNRFEAAARSAQRSEPPAAYWELLPRKVIERARERERDAGERPRLSHWWAPLRLRWVGAAALALCAGVIGIEVLELGERSQRNSPAAPMGRGGLSSAEPFSQALEIDRAGREPSPAPEPPPAPSAAVPRPSREKVADSEPESAASEHDLMKSEGEEQRLVSSLHVPPGEALPPPAEDAGAGLRDAAASGEEREAAAEEAFVAGAKRRSAASELSARAARSQPGEPASPPSQQASPDAATERYRALEFRYRRPSIQATSSREEPSSERRETADEDPSRECAAWRGFVASHPESAEAVPARYWLALCSIRLFDRAPGEKTSRQAIEDVNAFLSVSSEDERAEELRRELKRLESHER